MKAAALLAVSLLLLAFTLSPLPALGKKPTVIVTTTVLGSVVDDLAGNEVDLVTIVNPAICPAHYDVKPSDIYAVSNADLVIYHGFEKWIETIYETSGSKAGLFKISGPWATPDGIKSYYEEVASVLKDQLGIDVSDRLKNRIQELNEVTGEIQREAEKMETSSIKVITMSWQKEFVQWLGFDVVGEFGPPEKLSSADIEKLVELGKSEGVILVVSNLQSGTQVGERIAGEIGAVHVILSNFPESSPETSTLIDLTKENSKKIFEAIKLYELKKSISGLREEAELYRYAIYSLIVLAVVEAAFLIYLLRRSKLAR